MIDFPFTAPALRVVQRLGIYYTTVLSAEFLLQTCFSAQLRAIKETPEGYDLEGTQRDISVQRLREIGEYIDRSDSAFPNSIIIAANFREEDETIEEDENDRWTVSAAPGCDNFLLRIPSGKKLAAIIDGQHRLFGFRFANPEGLQTQMICSVFLDLPKPYQAQLFATINSTQKSVDKSLTYELFGYNIDEEASAFWSPEKLAVFLARRLNVEADSPFRGRILVAPENDFSLDGEAQTWKVSMATVVEGILRLISNNPRRDANALVTPERNTRKALRSAAPNDKSVLRNLYIEENDRVVYLFVRNFLEAANSTFWTTARPGSFITKTVGLQALFDVLRKLAPQALTGKDISAGYFTRALSPAAHLDFAAEAFRNASGSGRTQIRRAIEEAIGTA